MERKMEPSASVGREAEALPSTLFPNQQTTEPEALPPGQTENQMVVEFASTGQRRIEAFFRNNPDAFTDVLLAATVSEFGNE